MVANEFQGYRTHTKYLNAQTQRGSELQLPLSLSSDLNASPYGRRGGFSRLRSRGARESNGALRHAGLLFIASTDPRSSALVANNWEAVIPPSSRQ